MLQRLRNRVTTNGARALLVSPTRELALQTFVFLKEVSMIIRVSKLNLQLGKYTGVRAMVLIGGESMDEQFGAIHENPDMLVFLIFKFIKSI